MDKKKLINTKLINKDLQTVFDLIIEFYKNSEFIAIDDDYKKNYVENVIAYFRGCASCYDSRSATLFYLLNLKVILSDYLFVENFNEERLKSKIVEDYNERIYSEDELALYGLSYEEYKDKGYNIGSSTIKSYRKDLTTEKNVFGFKNLVIILEKLYNKESKDMSR